MCHKRAEISVDFKFGSVRAYRQTAKLNSPPNFVAIRYYIVHVYSYQSTCIFYFPNIPTKLKVSVASLSLALPNHVQNLTFGWVNVNIYQYPNVCMCSKNHFSK